MHSRRIEIFVHAALGMHAIKSADHVVIDHVNHRLGYRLIDIFKGINPFLHQYVRNLHSLFHHRHLVALFAV